MATLFTTIGATRYAAGTDATPEYFLDLMGNDWSTLSQSQGLYIAEVSSNDAVSGTSWVNIAAFYSQLPSFSLDTSYDALEIAVVVRFEAKVDAARAVDLRLESGGTTSNEVAVSGASYSWHSDFTIVFSSPWTSKKINLQRKFAATSNPADYVYARRQTWQSDLSVYVRAT